MANKTMHHIVIGSDTYEIVDEQGRANTATNTQDITALKGAIIRKTFVFANIIFQTSTKVWVKSTNRCATHCPICVDFPMFVSAKDGYKFGVLKWRDLDVDNASNYIDGSDPGWQTNGYFVLLPGNIYTFSIAKTNDSIISVSEAINNVVVFNTYSLTSQEFACSRYGTLYTSQIAGTTWRNIGRFESPKALTTELLKIHGTTLVYLDSTEYRMKAYIFDNSYNLVKSCDWTHVSNFQQARKGFVFEDLDGCFVSVCYEKIDDTPIYSETFPHLHIMSFSNKAMRDEEYYNFKKNNDVYTELSQGTLNGSTKKFVFATNTRVQSVHAMFANYDLQVSCAEGYNFGIIVWKGTDIDNPDNLLSDSGWINGEMIIKKGTYFTISVKKYDNKIIELYEAYSAIKMIRSVAEVNGGKYEVGGEIIDTTIPNKQTFDVSLCNIFIPTVDKITISSVQSLQGFAVYNDVYFQLYSNDVIVLINMTSGEKIAELSIKSDHGDCLDFSNEFYSENDEFPLAYITADSNPAKIYINRITREGTTLIRTLTFPVENTGYYAGHTLDSENNILYQVGYSENSYYDNTSGNNNMIVSAWNLLDLTDNGDGTYTPGFIEKYTLPFMRTVQGQSFFNGHIICPASHWENPQTTIYFIDTNNKKISTILSNFPSAIKNVEVEGAVFIPEKQNYSLLIKPNNTGNLYKLKFY